MKDRVSILIRRESYECLAAFSQSMGVSMSDALDFLVRDIDEPRSLAHLDTSHVIQRHGKRRGCI